MTEAKFKSFSLEKYYTTLSVVWQVLFDFNFIYFIERFLIERSGIGQTGFVALFTHAAARHLIAAAREKLHHVARRITPSGSSP